MPSGSLILYNESYCLSIEIMQLLDSYIVHTYIFHYKSLNTLLFCTSFVVVSASISASVS